MRTQQLMVIGLVIFACFVIISVTLAFTLSPLAGMRSYPALPTTPATTTTAPNTTTPLLTTTYVSTTYTTAANTTTPAPYFPLNITCPPDIVIVLGSSLNPQQQTGQAVATAQSNVACGAPVTFYSDNRARNDLKRSDNYEPQERYWSEEAQQGEPTSSLRGVKSNIVSLGKKRKRDFYSATGLGVLRANHNGASSSVQTISAYSSFAGGLYVVTDTNFVTVWLIFSAAQSFGHGICAQEGFWPTINWDNTAQRWIITERAVNSSTLCVYVSTTSDALDPWVDYQFTSPSVSFDYTQLGIWPQAYVISSNGTGNNICVLDRFALLSFDPAPSLFCSASISGNLGGFYALQSWTPLSVEGDAAMPPSDIESAGTNTIGAVWMRHHDDEFNDGSSTPTADWLDVEHWTSINFTTSTYIPLRYVITVADFDSSYANCQSETACIPVPTSNTTFVDPVREVIMRRLVYRSGMAWGSFVSNANGVDVAHVRWFQLVWSAPTLLLASQWIVNQQGRVGELGSTDRIHRWLPSIAVDSEGTAVLGYNEANETIPAQMAWTYLLANDPPNHMRVPETVTSPNGAVAQNMYSTEWGYYGSISTLPGTPRNFFFHGQVQVPTMLIYAFPLRISGETVTRTWFAQDLCNIVNCTQLIIQQ